MKNTICTLGLLGFFACSGPEKSTRVTSPDASRAAEADSQLESLKKPSEKPASRSIGDPQAIHWQYDQQVNPDGQTVYKASIASPATLQFTFPYAGGSTVSLTIRQREKEATVYLQVSNGQFNRSFQGGTVRIRFDGKPAVPYAYSAAENGSSTTIFFDEADQLIRQLKTAGNTIMDVSFYAQGNRRIVFHTAGLRWNHA